MTCAKLLLLSSALTVAASAPAFALNPQPLPPGYHSTAKFISTGRTTTFYRKAGGNQTR